MAETRQDLACWRSMKALSAFSFRLPSGAVHGRSVAAWRTLLPTLMMLSASVVAEAPCPRAADPTVQSLPGNSKILPIQLNPNVRLDLIQSESGNFLALGAVSVHGTPLRSAAHPMLVRLDTPEGILYTRLKFQGVEYDNDGAARIQLRAMGVPWGRGEFLDNYGQSLLWLNSANEPVIDDLALILRPASLSLGGRSWWRTGTRESATGFSET